MIKRSLTRCTPSLSLENDYSDFLNNKTYNKCTGYWYNNGVQTKRKNVTIHKNCTHYTTMYYRNNGWIQTLFLWILKGFNPGFSTENISEKVMFHQRIFEKRAHKILMIQSTFFNSNFLKSIQNSYFRKNG